MKKIIRVTVGQQSLKLLILSFLAAFGGRNPVFLIVFFLVTKFDIAEKHILMFLHFVNLARRSESFEHHPKINFSIDSEQ